MQSKCDEKQGAVLKEKNGSVLFSEFSSPPTLFPS